MHAYANWILPYHKYLKGDEDFSYLNRDNPRGEYSSLTNGGFSSVNVQANYPATASGISP